MGRYAPDDVTPAVFEPVDDFQANVGAPRMVVVVEPKTPYAYDRFTVLFGISGGGSVDGHFVGPIGFEFRLHVGPSADVVHDVKLTTVHFGGGFDFGRDGVAYGALLSVWVEPL